MRRLLRRLLVLAVLSGCAAEQAAPPPPWYGNRRQDDDRHWHWHWNSYDTSARERYATIVHERTVTDAAGQKLLVTTYRCECGELFWNVKVK